MNFQTSSQPLSDLYLNLCSNLIDPNQTFQCYLHEQPDAVADVLTEHITGIARSQINYKVEGELEKSISQLRAILIEGESRGGVANAIPILEAKDIPTTISANIDVMRSVVKKLKKTDEFPDQVIRRLNDEIDALERLAGQAVKKQPPGHIQKQIAYIQDLIQMRATGKRLPPTEEMRKRGLSEAAIQVLLSPKFVPYEPKFCQNLPINLHCRASAHNACISSAKDESGNAWITAQQKMTEIELLAFGVRQMEFDIAAAPEGTDDAGRIMICHGRYQEHDPEKIGHYESFHSKLWEATEWLKANPDETLIINLDCLRDKGITREQINNELAAFADMIFTPEDLQIFRGEKSDPTAWPTPVQIKGKRLLVMYPEELLEDDSQPRTFKNLTFDQDSIANTTMPGVSTEVTTKVRGAGDQSKRLTLIGFIKSLFIGKAKTEQPTSSEPKPLFMLYHNSAFPVEGTLPRYAYKALRNLLIRPLNFLFGTHLPDLSNEKLVVPDNSPGAIFRRFVDCEKRQLQPTSIHMDNFHEFAAEGGHGPLNGVNALRAMQHQSRPSTVATPLKEQPRRNPKEIPAKWKKYLSGDDDE